MSTAPRSVTFEEYREKSWHDVWKVLKEQCSNTNITSGSSRGNRHIPGASCNTTWTNDEFMILPPPPSLNCREHLVPTRDSATRWKSNVTSDSQCLPVDLQSSKYNILFSKKYVMPSSLVPVSQSFPRPVTFLPPPPTAYRDDVQNDNFSFDTESKSFIEIKRPTPFSSCESTSGLVKGLIPTTKLHSAPAALKKMTFEPTKQSNERVCSDIFDIPEVYNPPPLKRLPTPRLKLTLPSPRSKQLEGIMPSFVGNPSSFTSSVSPRVTYSEPFMRPEKPDYSPRSKSEACFDQGHEPTTPYHSSVLNILPRKSTGINLDGKYNNTVTFHHELPISSQRSQKEVNSVHYPLFGKRHDAHESKPGTPLTKDMGGAGDVKSTKLTAHNCLSPRALMASNVIPPSVITPVVANALLEDCLSLLRSLEWEDNFEAFSQIYSLTEIHPGLVKNVLTKIIWAGYPHLSSSRTKLARMACICFKRLFQTQRRSMEIEGEKVFYKLLDLCGAMINNFFQQECKEALSAAVENMDPLKCITFLELHGARHKNPHVREYAAYLLNSIMDEQPVSKLMNKDFSPRIIPMIVGFLKEGLLQTRLTAKLALDKIFDHSTFKSKLRRYVSPENVRHITETLREFKERRNGHGHGHT